MTTIYSLTDLLAQGLSTSEVRGKLARGELNRLAIGRYVAGGTDQLKPEQLHAVRTRAELSRFTSPRVMASHTSAAVLHGLPIIDTRLDRVEVTRDGRTGGRKTKRSEVRARRVDDADRTVIGSTPTTTVARTLIDLARSVPLTTVVAAADHALRHTLVTSEEVIAALERIHAGPGLPKIRRILRLADGRCESPGESKQQVVLTLGGITGLELQVEILDQHQRLVGRADGALLDHKILLEFDGVEKYRRYRKPGESVTDAVLREKKRERRLRDLGWEVVRFDWADLTHRDHVVQRVRDEIWRCEHRPTPQGSVRLTDPIRIEC